MAEAKELSKGQSGRPAQAGGGWLNPQTTATGLLKVFSSLPLIVTTNITSCTLELKPEAGSAAHSDNCKIEFKNDKCITTTLEALSLSPLQESNGVLNTQNI